MTHYIYPQNLKATANMWLWSLRDFAIMGVAALLSIVILVELHLMLPAAATLCYWMHSVIAAAVREQQKEHLYTLSRPFVDILCEELNTGRVFGKEYEKAYLIPFSWSIADIMEKHWCVEDDTDYLTSLFHICFSCSNYILALTCSCL